MNGRTKALIAALVLLGLVGAYGVLSWSGALAEIMDKEALGRWIERLGVLGPVGIIALMCMAIVLNPIPSAPIALAAGAVYGHFWGTIYVAIGAEAGALIAFGIARLVGYDVLRKWLGDHLSLGRLTSQNALMAIVFVSRLLPFISFDLVSYAAGLTPLRLWRFAVATLAGILPASFLLAHFGGELATFDSDRVLFAIAALGAVTIIPFLGKALWDRHHGKPGLDETKSTGQGDPGQ
ncbi:MAG: TVP38/TMEM64 family protein [Rhodospirillales bacterium]